MSRHSKAKSPTPKRPKTKLGLPDLDHSKSAVLDSLRSPESKRGYRHAIDEFIQWCGLLVGHRHRADSGLCAAHACRWHGSFRPQWHASNDEQLRQPRPTVRILQTPTPTRPSCSGRIRIRRRASSACPDRSSTPPAPASGATRVWQSCRLGATTICSSLRTYRSAAEPWSSGAI